MSRSNDESHPRPGPSGSLKPPEAQVEEIQKLVADAQAKLDQVSRALSSVRDRVGGKGSQRPRA